MNLILSHIHFRDEMRRLENHSRLYRTPLEPEPLSISEIFHENSKMKRLPRNRITHPVVEDEEILINMATHAYKNYSTAKAIKLIPNLDPINKGLEAVLLARRSIRKYSAKPISLRKLSKLLILSAGITGRIRVNKENVLKVRAYPSGGGLYPLEIYPVVFRSDEMNKGLYHYNVKRNTMELINSGELKRKISKTTLYPEVILNSSLVLLLTAVFSRTTLKYGERGYRFVLLEAGHLAQNIYLIATALNLGCVAIGGFIDDELNELLKLDGVNESIIYALALGTKYL